MKRIKSQDEIEKSRKRNALIVGVVMIALMLFSTAGYALLSGGVLGGSSQNQNGDYNGNYFVYQKNGRDYYFLTAKNTANEVPVDITFEINDYIGEKIYLVSEGDQKSWNQIALNLGNLVSGMQEACYGSCEKDLPEKDCTEKLIVWGDSDENKVYQEDQCIFVEGDLQALDAFLYKIIGIE